MKRIQEVLLCASLTVMLLTTFPYFPVWWIAGFTIFIVILAFGYPSAAMTAALALGAVPIAFHSLSFLIVYLMAAALALVLVFLLDEGVEKAFLVMGAPLLATLVIGGKHVPLEILALYLAPVWGKGLHSLWLSACAWLSAVFFGCVVNGTTFGSLILGAGGEPLFRFHTLPREPFYAFSWLAGYFTSLHITESFKYALHMLGHMFRTIFIYPTVLIEGVAWMSATYVLMRIIRNPFRIVQYGGFLAAAAIVGAGHWIVLELVPFPARFSLSFFLVGIFSLTFPAFVLLQLQKAYGDD